MFENVPLLRELSTKLFSENSFTWISLKDILQFLRQHHSITDHIKEIKRFNILKEFKGHKFGVLEKENEPYINVTSFLRYIFNHCDQLQICSEIVLQIQSKLTQKRDEFCFQNTQDLYKVIASKNFTYSKLQDVVYNEISIDEDKISSLHKQYKSDFTKDEWVKICLVKINFYSSLKQLKMQSLRNKSQQITSFFRT
ncbi:unnamed protein product [Mytilus edulis]|uniref:Uncharacterized protein n=1 Tax=Mytilus edulis TaxID=6550 RepID=A0A8S3UNI5_MYTED|nr:unnamed protein product [Mytilus edulis]